MTDAELILFWHQEPWAADVEAFVKDQLRAEVTDPERLAAAIAATPSAEGDLRFLAQFPAEHWEGPNPYLDDRIRELTGRVLLHAWRELTDEDDDDDEEDEL